LFYRKNLLLEKLPEEVLSVTSPEEGSSSRTQIVFPEEGSSRKLPEEPSSGSFSKEPSFRRRNYFF